MKTAREFAESRGYTGGELVADIEARDAEHRAELNAAQATIEQLGKDGATLATENERLRGELAEAKQVLLEVVDCEKVTPDCHRRILDFLYPPAPPPAESTPVPCDCKPEHQHCEECRPDLHAAPPDDIRARLDRLEAKVELNAALCKAATKCTEVGLANVAAALEANGSDRCARADCGRPRRWGGHGGHHVFVSALEAKGEPGTHAKGEVR